MKLKLLLIIVSIFLCISNSEATKNEVTITTDEQYRYITSNGIPDHLPGQFPNHGNPNTISEQHYHYRMPLHPTRTGYITQMREQPFGVAVNGVPFDPDTAEFYNHDSFSGWNYDALSGKIDLGIDQHNAHVQPNGAYHYHGIPQGVKKDDIVGYAADGFAIVIDTTAKPSYRLKQGARPSGPGGTYDGTFVQDFEFVKGYGNLDECNGQTNAASEYEYVLAATFPFIPRCWKGTPDTSFERGPRHEHQQQGGLTGMPQRQQSNGREPPRPPQEAVVVCQSKSYDATCEFQSPHGKISGRCANLAGTVACRPDGRTTH